MDGNMAAATFRDMQPPRGSLNNKNEEFMYKKALVQILSSDISQSNFLFT